MMRKYTMLILILMFLVSPAGAIEQNTTNNSIIAIAGALNLTTPTSANTVENAPNTTQASSTDVASYAVAKGGDMLLTWMGDDIYKQVGKTRGFIFKFITWNIRPDQIPVISQFYRKNLVLALPLSILFILGAVISRSIYTADPASYTNVFGRKDMTQNDIVGGGLFMLIGLAFGLIFLGVMSFLDLVNAYLMLSIMDSIAPSVSNGILYLFMALIELGLCIFFIYRQMWIVIAYAISPIYGIFFAAGYFKDFIDAIGDKFVRAMLMQPMCILTTVIGIIVMKAVQVQFSGITFFSGENSAGFFIALYFILLGVCCWCVFGNMTTVKRIGKMAIKAVV